jgi:hypothetical protein
MDFKHAARLGGLIAKDFAEGMFRLLVDYQSISASEAASRLDLHIKTSQEFLEGLHTLGILSRREVYEKKRPYFRYSLKEKTLTLELDLSTLRGHENPRSALKRKIREKTDSGCRFQTGRGGDLITAVAIWSGRGRNRREKKINLTRAQGEFLFHLPFPTAEALAVGDIMKRAGVDDLHGPEILDLVQLLASQGVIEILRS